MTQPWTDPSMTATFRCSLDLDGERVSVYQRVDRMLLVGHPQVRDRIEHQLRFDLGRAIAEKLAPEIEEVSPDGPTPEGRVTRDEALRLAKVQAKALTRLAERLEEAGENYALPAAWHARDAALALVEKLEGDDGRLPTDPRFWTARGRRQA